MRLLDFLESRRAIESDELVPEVNMKNCMEVQRETSGQITPPKSAYRLRSAISISLKRRAVLLKSLGRVTAKP